MLLAAHSLFSPAGGMGAEDAGDQSGFNITGNYKNLFLYFNDGRYLGKDVTTVDRKKLYSDQNRLRLSPEFQYGKSFLVHADIDNEIFFSNYAGTRDFQNLWGRNGYDDAADLTWESQRGNITFLRANVHRAYMKLTVKDLTLTLGRQQISFGSGRLWNPLDILNPVSPTFVEGPENRKGRDAAKGDYYFNDFTVLTAVYDPGKSLDRNGEDHQGTGNYLGRFKSSIGTLDAAVLAGVVSERDTAGADVSANLFNGLLRGCVLVSKKRNEKSYFIANGGYEYTFERGLYFLIEYFYNENALHSNSELKSLYEESVYAGIHKNNYAALSNRIFTYNSHYAGIALGYDLHPLFRAEIFLIYDFQGRGVFINPGIKYNVMENIDISAGAMLGKMIGETGRISDFKEYENNRMYMGSVTVYF